MCGIICYIGNKQAVPILLNGLKTLEYRGYDSAGLCVKTKKGLEIVKKKGKIDEFSKIEQLADIKGTIGIGHTRWATHGEPNDINAHPHYDCKKEIAIIHNGIIENYSVLEKMLVEEGHKFESKTDSEVLAHLIEKFYLENNSTNLKTALQKSLALIEGTFGIAVMQKDKNEIVVARRGSPLVLGVGEGEMFAASDATALLKYTNNVIYLQDNELAVLTKDKYSVENLNGVKIKKQVEKINWSVKQVAKQGYKHFMLKEIYEQPESIENCLRGRIKDEKIKLTLNIDKDYINSVDRAIIVACGTSWHSALIGKYLIEQFTGIPVEVDYASEFRYRNPIIRKDNLVIAISQSGETADTLAALREAKSKKANTIGIINVVGSTIAREVDSGIYIHAGPEIGVASTKAFTSQITSLMLLGLYLRQEQGQKLDPDLLYQIQKLPETIRETLKVASQIKELAKNFIDSKNFLFLGRDINFPVALEGALKLKEISYIHAEGYPAAEMKHGPIALIDENMPVVFIATKNNLSDKLLNNIEEVKARKGNIILIKNENDSKLEKLADHSIIVPYVRNELCPIINAIPLQLLAYHVADMKGLDVDKPRNLAKSVTVE